MSKVIVEEHKNQALHSAKRNNNDEFYTTRKDIDQELIHYHDQLKGKVIYCNCDNYKHSEFFNYFKDNFDVIKPKKVIFTYLSGTNKVKKATISKKGVKVKTIKSTGSFDSPESIEILKKSDIVITNPPFSMFRAFISLPIQYNKDYLIIGSYLGVTAIPVVPHAIDGTHKVGYTKPTLFVTPGGSIEKLGIVEWHTTLENNPETRPFGTYDYNIEDYRYYDNTNILSCDTMKSIPLDYTGYMGVPLSIFCRYDCSRHKIHELIKKPIIDGRQKFKRVLIRLKKKERRKLANSNKNSKQKA